MLVRHEKALSKEAAKPYNGPLEHVTSSKVIGTTVLKI